METAPGHRARRRLDPWRAYVAVDANDVAGVATVAARVRENINSVIQRTDDVVTTAVTVLLAECHLLIVPIPALGTHTTSHAVARPLHPPVTPNHSHTTP